jgi:hypothetical protein
MDGTHFDTLAKSLATTRVTRLTALRGLAVGALAAAIGVTAPADDAAAAKKKCPQCKKKVCHKANNGPKRCRCKKKANGTFCSIPGATSATCQFGSCVAAATPVPPGPGPTPAPPPAPVGCSSSSQCSATGQICVNGTCLGGEQCFVQFGICFPGSPLVCTRTVAGGLACLLEDQGFGLCDPGPNALTPVDVAGYQCATAETCDNVCGTPGTAVNNVSPYCYLGACIVNSDNPACPACQGVNFTGICVNLVENPPAGCQSFLPT